ncbi:cobalt-precorrin-6X reductase [Novosphingobium barchaimii]|nr:cobalt-precorrin-6X reductase [Novosphingobium barchaimii]
MLKVLILGGTTEASALATLLAKHGIPAILSYAGRTRNPQGQPVPMRVGGFGGATGLAQALRDQGFTHLVDATHPFAATISANAIAASAEAGVPLLALTRPAWQAQPGDRWSHVSDLAGAVDALAGPPRRVFLALGRMHVGAFALQPQHHYVLRFVDKPETPPPLPHHGLIVDRGPFSVAGDRALLQEHGVDWVVCKNAGGGGAEAKLIAARELGVPVLMITRPPIAPRHEVHDPAAVLDWLDHHGTIASDRGV